MNGFLYPLSVIAVTALVTWFTRALPFLAFGKRKLSPMMIYLGKVLPPAIMVILVAYCLKGTVLTAYPHGIPEIAACLAVFLAQRLKGNMYLSIILGTAVYMLLIRVM